VTDVALHNEALRVVHAQGGRISFGHVGSTSMREPDLTYPSFYPPIASCSAATPS